MKVLTLDPSGNFDEGKGHTGWAIFENKELRDFGAVNADDYKTIELYFNAVFTLFADEDINLIICEGYRLYAGARGKAQINSSLETPQLIGYLRMKAWEGDIPFILQPPSDKAPVNDERLVKAGVFEKRGTKHYCLDRPTNLHMRDAIRHGVYYYRFGGGKNGGKKS